MLWDKCAGKAAVAWTTRKYFEDYFFLIFNLLFRFISLTGFTCPCPDALIMNWQWTRFCWNCSVTKMSEKSKGRSSCRPFSNLNTNYNLKRLNQHCFIIWNYSASWKNIIWWILNFLFHLRCNNFMK